MLLKTNEAHATGYAIAAALSTTTSTSKHSRKAERVGAMTADANRKLANTFASLEPLKLVHGAISAAWMPSKSRATMLPSSVAVCGCQPHSPAENRAIWALGRTIANQMYWERTDLASAVGPSIQAEFRRASVLTWMSDAALAGWIASTLQTRVPPPLQSLSVVTLNGSTATFVGLNAEEKRQLLALLSIRTHPDTQGAASISRNNRLQALQKAKRLETKAIVAVDQAVQQGIEGMHRASRMMLEATSLQQKRVQEAVRGASSDSFPISSPRDLLRSGDPHHPPALVSAEALLANVRGIADSLEAFANAMLITSSQVKSLADAAQDVYRAESSLQRALDLPMDDIEQDARILTGAPVSADSSTPSVLDETCKSTSGAATGAGADTATSCNSIPKRVPRGISPRTWFYIATFLFGEAHVSY